MNDSQYDQVLVGRFRAQLDHAARLQRRVQWIQVGIAVVAVVSVFVTASSGAYFAAISGLILAAAYAWFGHTYRTCRSVAEEARRAVLVSGGLGEGLSLAARRTLLVRFSVPQADGATREDATYYATNAKAGPRRLADMIEESAFWSADLHGQAAKNAWIRLAVFFGISLLALATLPFLGASGLSDSARAICAMLVLFMSNEVLGAALGHRDASRAAGQVVERLQQIKAEGCPLADLMLLAGDYNAAIESAPMVPSNIYDARKTELNGLWKEHQTTE